VIQTWEITSDGTTSGARPAKVQVTAIFEREVTTVAEFGLFATSPNCGALTFGGGMSTDSYDSTAMNIVNGKPQTQLWGGNVGSNGNRFPTIVINRIRSRLKMVQLATDERHCRTRFRKRTRDSTGNPRSAASNERHAILQNSIIKN